MCRLFEYADRYLKESDWKDIALIKLCLCEIGVLPGINLAQKYMTAYEHIKLANAVFKG